MSSITPLEAIEDARALLTGLPACLVGSAVVSMELGQSEFLADASDIDIFCYTDYALIAIIQKLQHTTIKWIRGSSGCGNAGCVSV